MEHNHICIQLGASYGLGGGSLKLELLLQAWITVAPKFRRFKHTRKLLAKLTLVSFICSVA